jgi:hypothetical protein
VLVASAIAAASVLLLLPYTSPIDYARVLLDVGRMFDQYAYTLFALLAEIGVEEPLARASGLAVGAALVVATWKTRSFALAVAAVLALSPIVWLDYFALLAIPLAVVRPTFSLIWLAPLATWGLLSAGTETGNGWGIVRVLIVFALVVAVTFRAERRQPSLRSDTNARASDPVTGVG